MTESERDNWAETLRVEFPDLDSALVAAIAYDVPTLEQARDQCGYLSVEAIVDKEGENDIFSWEDYDNQSDETFNTELDLEALQVIENQPMQKKHEFLAMCFPADSFDKLKTVLMENENNVAKTLDQLLSERCIVEDHNSSDGLDLKKPILDWSSAERKGKKSSRKNQQKSKELTKFSISDEDWASSFPELARVSSILSIPISSTRQMFGIKNYSSTLTILAMLDARPGSIWDITVEHLKENENLLKEWIPELPSLTCSKILVATSNDMESATEIALILCENATREKKKLGQPAFTVVPTAFKDKDFVAVNSKKPAREMGGTLVTGTDVSRRSLAELEQLMESKYETKSKFVSQSAELYRRRHNNVAYAAAAAHYSQRARDISGEIRQHRLNRARAVVAQSRQGPYSVDFHSVTVHDADIIAHEELDRWWAKTAGQSPRPVFKMVTGRGLHSADGRSRLLPFLLQTLAGAGWMVRAGTGFLEVYGFRNEP
ncbi:hypothetical protein V1512DRAFT_238057 [Lipomyces arxii]|uniref:uncharacterized protein n=1 Tax=Lipomyces arxii TaxID=56418 RepID=UPI0034CD895A